MRREVRMIWRGFESGGGGRGPRALRSVLSRWARASTPRADRGKITEVREEEKTGGWGREGSDDDEEEEEVREPYLANDWKIQGKLSSRACDTPTTAPRRLTTNTGPSENGTDRTVATSTFPMSPLSSLIHLFKWRKKRFLLRKGGEWSFTASN